MLRNGSITCSGRRAWELLVVCVQHQRLLKRLCQQETRQAANRLLGNGCCYVPNFGHSEVSIKMTDEMPLLLAPSNKFVTLNIFGRKFSVDFPTSDDWCTECVVLIGGTHNWTLSIKKAAAHHGSYR
jgi:hypothetical protein